MKKITALILALVCMLCLSGCSDQKAKLDIGEANSIYVESPFGKAYITDHSAIFRITENINSLEYERTSAICDEDEYVYLLKWLDADNNEIKSVAITEENGQQIGYKGYYYNVGADLCIDIELIGNEVVKILSSSLITDVVPASPETEYKDDVVLSYANWTEASEIYFGALNKDKMAISSVQHLPIYKFDTLNDLEQFKQTFGNTFTMDSSWDEVPSFNDATAKYDSAFFEENSLILIYVSANNSTHRFNVHNVIYDDTSFCVHIEETTKAVAVDEAMAGWFVTISVSDELIKDCMIFDADLNNGTNG